MKKGDIIYVHSLEDKSQPGKLMIYQETCCKKDPPRIQGVSVYEECILCKDPKTGALNNLGPALSLGGSGRIHRAPEERIAANQKHCSVRLMGFLKERRHSYVFGSDCCGGYPCCIPRP